MTTTQKFITFAAIAATIYFLVKSKKDEKKGIKA